MKNYTKHFALLSSSLFLAACGVEPTDTSKTTTDSASVESSLDVSKTPPYCTSNDVFLMAETDRSSYRPGQNVYITSVTLNVSNHSCSLGVGPIAGVAPLVSINDPASNNEQLWSNCYVSDMHGACYETWTYQTLKSGDIFTRQFTWDQGSNEPGNLPAPHRLPDGTYNVSTTSASLQMMSDPISIRITG